MKIAFISQGHGRIDPPDLIQGSIAIWTYEIVKQLSKTEDVTIYEMDGGLINSSQKKYEGAKYIYAPILPNRLFLRLHRMARRSMVFTHSENHNKRPFFESGLHNLGFILWVALHLKSQQCDVIHIPQFSQYVPIIRAFNKTSKIVLRMDCEWLTLLDRDRTQKRLEKADLVLGCSDYITKKIEDKFPEFRKKIKTVYNGVQPQKFKIISKNDSKQDFCGPRLLFVGRVSPEKGIHVLIRALKMLVEKYPSIHLTIVGSIYGCTPKEYIVDLSDDPVVKGLEQYYTKTNGNRDYYFESLKQMVNGEIESNITFTGSVPHEKVIAFYQSSDIIVNPSLSESFGMSLIEAMALQKPVVATRVGGMVNIVEEETTGFLVKPGDHIGLAITIKRLIEQPDLAQKMGRKGRERVLHKFTWDKIASDLIGEYKRLF